MSGHSKWSTIKHKKARLDAKRGKLWSKLARNITMIARSSGGSIDASPSLRLAVDKAKAANMPKDTIEKAIKKGTGELDGVNYEEVVYEGYGSGGVAVMATALTDNRTRTAPEIKRIFERAGGSLGAINSVAWMFSKQGLIMVPKSAADEDKLMELALENGADDVAAEDDHFSVTTPPDAYLDVKEAIEAAGITIESSDVSLIPSNYVTPDAETARKIMRLVEALEDHDDVESVATNMDIPDDVLAEMS